MVTSHMSKRFSNWFVCLFVCLDFFVTLENFSIILRRHHNRWRDAKFDLYSILVVIEQWVILNVPHLLWHGPDMILKLNCWLPFNHTIPPSPPPFFFSIFLYMYIIVIYITQYNIEKGLYRLVRTWMYIHEMLVCWSWICKSWKIFVRIIMFL